MAVELIQGKVVRGTGYRWWVYRLSNGRYFGVALAAEIPESAAQKRAEAADEEAANG